MTYSISHVYICPPEHRRKSLHVQFTSLHNLKSPLDTIISASILCRFFSQIDSTILRKDLPEPCKERLFKRIRQSPSSTTSSAFRCRKPISRRSWTLKPGTGIDAAGKNFSGPTLLMFVVVIISQHACWSHEWFITTDGNLYFLPQGSRLCKCVLRKFIGNVASLYTLHKLLLFSAQSPLYCVAFLFKIRMQIQIAPFITGSSRLIRIASLRQDPSLSGTLSIRQ